MLLLWISLEILNIYAKSGKNGICGLAGGGILSKSAGGKIFRFCSCFWAVGGAVS